MLLRGFDRDIVDKIQVHMEQAGINIKMGLLPESIEKLDSGKLKVTYSDGDSGTRITVSLMDVHECSSVTAEE
jgi:pyruvate/2-oxoglutarate dehydrogenase complex dihydrolipoamide dehydrogenase (E3) component